MDSESSWSIIITRLDSEGDSASLGEVSGTASELEVVASSVGSGYLRGRPRFLGILGSDFISSFGGLILGGLPLFLFVTVSDAVVVGPESGSLIGVSLEWIPCILADLFVLFSLLSLAGSELDADDEANSWKVDWYRDCKRLDERVGTMSL
jgi:hypothetical protein